MQSVCTKSVTRRRRDFKKEVSGFIINSWVEAITSDDLLSMQPWSNRYA